MKIADLKPNPYLSPYISRYWVWEDEQDLPKMLPGTGAELIFHYNESILATNCCGIKNHLPKCYIASPRHVFYSLNPIARTGFIAVRFRAGAFRHFCMEAHSDLIDTFIDIADIWGQKGVELGEEVLTATTIDERIIIIERYLTRFLLAYKKQEAWLDKVVNRALYEFNTIGCAELSNELSISSRHLQRKFKEATGVSLKTFLRISRFESVIKELLLNKQKDYLPIALNHGYYDQAHFIRDFKSCVGEQPSIFLQDRNFLSHFYNARLGK